MKRKRAIVWILLASMLVGCGSHTNQSIEKEEPVQVEQVSPTIDYENLTVDKACQIANGLVHQEGTLQEGYELYKWIIEQAPNYPTGYVGAAFCYTEVGNYEKARAYLEEGKAYMDLAYIDADSLASLYWVQGEMYQVMYRYEGETYSKAAIESYQKVLEVEGLSKGNWDYYAPEVYGKIAGIYTGMAEYGYIDEGIEYLSKKYELDHTDGNAQSGLATLYSVKGDFEQAKKSMDAVLPFLPKEGQDILQAQYYTYKGEYKEAKKYLERANKQKLDSVYINKYNIAKAYYEERQGNLEEVEKCIEKLIEISPYVINRGIIQELIDRTGITLDKAYYEKIEKEKEEKYSFSFES